MFSVVIPVHNKAPHVARSIQSVLDQTYKNFEMIIINDASTDDSMDEVSKFDDPRIRVFQRNEPGPGGYAARNLGIEKANAEWIAFLDADDVWLSEKLAKQICYIKEAKENIVGLATGSYIFDFERNTKLSEHIPNKPSYITQELLYRNYLRGFSSFIFKKEAALTNDGFDESFPAMQDMDFYISLSMNGEIHVIQDTLVYVRIDNSDRISKNFNKKYQAALELHQKYYKVISSNTKLLNRSKSRIIVYSFKTGNKGWLKDFYWIFLGLFIDMKNFIWTIKSLKNK